MTRDVPPTAPREASSPEALPPEAWLAGPIDGVPALLQPVAHALTQAARECTRLMNGLPDEQLWLTPYGNASVGFHLQHMAGVLDRLTTYAAGNALSSAQLTTLEAEGRADVSVSGASLLQQLHARVAHTIERLRHTSETALAEQRLVGRRQLPSTVIGLFVHAAEHMMRHTGQLLVTTRVLNGNVMTDVARAGTGDVKGDVATDVATDVAADRTRAADQGTGLGPS